MIEAVEALAHSVNIGSGGCLPPLGLGTWPAAGVRVGWRRARLDRRRLPRCHLGPARRRCPPRRAGALAAVGDANGERPPDVGVEGDLRVSAGVLRRHRLGLWDVGPHPAHTPRTLGRQLRMVRPIRQCLVQRPGRGRDDDPHAPAGARAELAAHLPRLLDGCLPGDRRLIAAPETAEAGRRSALAPLPKQPTRAATAREARDVNPSVLTR